MKKCPECGNPSYDGAPVCGNCGYKFPKQKVAARRDSIFEGQQKIENKPKKEKPKVNKPSNEPSVIDVIKEKKLIIGIILLITLIVICGIFITGSNKNNTVNSVSGDLAEYNGGDFSFKYPGNWEKVNLTDSDHETAIFFKGNDTLIEHYNISSSATSLKEINQQRISSALYDGDTVELLETVTLDDGKNISNVILENANGNYTRYVSMLNDGKLFVFKITGDSINSTTADNINSVLNSAKIS